jgi:hypothetical protein
LEVEDARHDSQPAVFVRASELMAKGDSGISTGYSELDEVIGRLQGGLVYLFCGGSFVDRLVHRLMVRACAVGKVGYMNNTDYYSEKTLVDLDMLASLSKLEGMEPDDVLESIYFVAAYNAQRQRKVASVFAEMVRSEMQTKLIVIHNAPMFLVDPKSRLKVAESLNKSLVIVYQLAARMGIPVVVTAPATQISKLATHRPFGSSWMRHSARVIVHFRETGNEMRVVATLIKHPSRPAPVSFHVSADERVNDKKWSPSKYVQLLGEEHRRAFVELERGAWETERRACECVSLLPFDTMNLTASVFVMKEIWRLRKRLEELVSA